MHGRRTIGSSDNASVLGGVKAKNNGRYNGDGRHWGTPPEIFDPLHAEFTFTLDPCATPESAKCSTYFTEADDGLTQDWSGHRVFMNPPYGKEVYAWTRKARMEQAKGVLVVGLLPASCDLAWWHDDVVKFGEVRYIRGRPRFTTGGPYRASGFFASVIVVWRPTATAPDLQGEWRYHVPQTSLIEDDVAPAPWNYDGNKEVIVDNDGNVVVSGARALTCERIVRAVNEQARKDNIIS